MDPNDATYLTRKLLSQNPEDPDDVWYYFEKNGYGWINPLHDIPLYVDKQKGILNMIVEIPRWTNAKLELKSAEPLAPIVQDTKNGKRRYVHNVYPYKGYIWNYGCFPQTWEDPSQVHMETGALGDGDPLDVCEIGTTIAKVGEIKQVKVLGVLGMIDSGEMDWKIVAIDVHDRLAEELNDVDDLYRMLPGLQHATFSWFRTYKIPDGKKENLFAFREEIQSRSYAMEIVEECHKSWHKLVTGRVTHPNHNCINTTLEPSFSPYRCHVEEADKLIRALQSNMRETTNSKVESKLTRNQSLAEITKGDADTHMEDNAATRQLLTIKRFCTQQQRQFPHGSNDLALLMSEMGVAFKCIAAYVKDRPLIKLYDMQRYADFQIYSSLASSGLCCLIYSTFAKEFLSLDKNIPVGNYVVVYTPLCGVMGGSLGTIFSVYYRKSSSGKEGDTSDLLQRTGFDQVAAGYCLYSSSIVFTFSIGFGVHMFGLDIVSGHFVVAHPHVHIPERGLLYSVDTQVISKAVDGVDAFIANIEKDASRHFRFEDCIVANFHKILCQGGIMMLPGPRKENLANFLGEAAPFAFLARQAGGRASVGRRPVLELSAWSLEMCVPLFIGSKEDVDEVERLVLGHSVIEKTVMGATVMYEL
ncbi:inorganic pyrophosphatase [Galdieria sulphuraria]|uniref:inorganic diphosphatase n=1 Tax=Galdieria sulphuraria TaxID=130081 RepID=M2VXI5_GALSU|nr:inorganic pyrophosphatase [Galdieria sulphuraria]EME27976.1 inorganic pyrophosphatase [Galdieria sulphuraria]|eukprot:XP_005704496.1 inorganic pyrophosphatase [Galdieria sulphuraria]